MKTELLSYDLDLSRRERSTGPVNRTCDVQLSDWAASSVARCVTEVSVRHQTSYMGLVTPRIPMNDALVMMASASGQSDGIAQKWSGPIPHEGQESRCPPIIHDYARWTAFSAFKAFRLACCRGFRIRAGYLIVADWTITGIRMIRMHSGRQTISFRLGSPSLDLYLFRPVALELLWREADNMASLWLR